MAKGGGRVGMQFDHVLEEFHLPLDDVEELLARLRCRGEADEIHRMAGGERVPDLALRLESTDAGSLAGARVHDHDRPLACIGLHAAGRHDAR